MLAAPSGQPRISQLLPSVTCSSCSNPVLLDELADHVCKPSPPPPHIPSSSLSPSSPSSSSKTSLLTQRINAALQGRTDPRQSASATTDRSSYSTYRSASPTHSFRTRSRSRSRSRSPSPTGTVRSQPTPTSSRHRARPPSDARSSTSTTAPLGRPRIPSRGFSDSTSAISRAPPSRSQTPNIPRAASAASNRSNASAPTGRRPSILDTPLPPTPPSPLHPHALPSHLIRRPSAESTLSSRSSRSSPPVSIPPSMRVPTLSSSPPPVQQDRRPSFGSAQPPHPNMHRPSVSNTPAGYGPDSRRPSPAPYPDSRRPSPSPYHPDSRRPSPGPPRHPPPPIQLPPIPHPQQLQPPSSSTSTSPQLPLSPASISPNSPGSQHSIHDERDIDTKIGGEAGMAGVGRRGFAAAARAAMFASSPVFGSSGFPGAPFGHGQGGGGGVRSNAPLFLDIGAAMPTLPPINPLGSPLSLSPHSTRSRSPTSPAAHNQQPLQQQQQQGQRGQAHAYTSSTATAANTGSTAGTSPTLTTPPSPTPTRGSMDRLPPSITRFEADEGPETARPGYFFDKDKDKDKPIVRQVEGDESDDESIDDMALRLSRELEDLAINFTSSSFMSGNGNGGRSSRSATPSDFDSEDEGGGLAYAASVRSSVADSTLDTRPLSTKDGDAAPLDIAAALRGQDPEPEPTPRPDSRASVRSKGHSRTGSRGFAPTFTGPDTGTGPVRAPTPSNAMATDVRGAVDAGPPGAWGIVRAKTATAAEAVRERERERESDVVKRGGTISGAIGGSPGKVEEERRRKRRKCVKCESGIEDGKWVRVENGKGVLCERCWKGMYLPKCRRCGLAIEKQAVSSSDGQLKGKYHRECFNCTTCQKPFPDKEFYVFEGKPYCAYHYHEANNSLCSAPTCGHPIEGPCALSHSGARYHPEHMTCEYVDSDAEDDDDEEQSDYSDEDDEDEDDDAHVRRRIGRETLVPGKKQKKVRMSSGKGGKAAGKGRCQTRLEEYWEVEGRMLCERHMRRVVGTERMRAERAQRRVTRFVDLSDFR